MDNFIEKKYCIIISLSTPWENYHREQFIRNFAEKIKDNGSYIICIEPTILSIFNIIKYPSRILKWLKGNYKFRQVGENIYAVPAITLEHILLSVRFFVLSKINLYLLAKQIDKTISKINKEVKHKILFLHRPELVFLLGSIGEIGAIYDCCDDYCLTSNLNPLKVIGNYDRERNLSKKCNFVITTSEKLYKRNIEYNSNTYLVENAYSPFFESEKLVDNLLFLGKLHKPIIAYIGNIRDWIDFELLEYLFKSRSEWNFVFIGAVDKTAEKQFYYFMNKYSNVYLSGRVSYQDYSSIKSYVDVGIIPFKMNKFMESVNPNKFYEMCGLGLSIVSTDIGDIKNKYSSFTQIANSKESFLDSIEYILNLDDISRKNLKKEILQFAVNQTWASRAEFLCHLINNKIINL